MRLALTALAFAFTAAPALAGAPTLEASLSTPSQGRIITRSAAWNCGETGCFTTSSESRPMVQCQLLAKEAGALSRFAVNGVDFAADELAKCNKKAR